MDEEGRSRKNTKMGETITERRSRIVRRRGRLIRRQNGEYGRGKK